MRLFYLAPLLAFAASVAQALPTGSNQVQNQGTSNSVQVDNADVTKFTEKFRQAVLGAYLSVDEISNLIELFDQMGQRDIGEVALAADQLSRILQNILGDYPGYESEDGENRQRW
ncbi:hypothetical protein BX661DRAFT_176282 [Kickxella alabastrina]|uniref:uncharacterized protein n=1 Tax=Kickxella alabastrina TaxID=61397 RepID=UPI00221F19D3|nr:uncharacterized protein BX661DRAFT_176282 [Kickxella alabastrina]KAI7835195.1 hypothetical protein BX661DRAFT_176282 [Kickxella alabastrina]